MAHLVDNTAYSERKCLSDC